MLSAAATENVAYEGLNGYLAANGGAPTNVPSFDASARQPAGVPGGALPGVNGRVSTSSAQPGKRSNQCITYARLCTKLPAVGFGSVPDAAQVKEGDIVFVHRYDGMYTGHDANKPTRVASLAQLNAMLRTNGGMDDHNAAEGLYWMPSHDSQAPPSALSPEGRLPPDVEDCERLLAQQLTVDEQQVALDIGAMPANDRPREGTPEYAVEYAKRITERQNTQPLWANCLAEYTEAERAQRDLPLYKWGKGCRTLAEWTLDGICCGTESEHRRNPLVDAGDASNAGELLNIAIGGPTLMRNAAKGPMPQHVDDGMRTLDKVFVGLVAYVNFEKNPGALAPGSAGYNVDNPDVQAQRTWYTYQYKAFTSRQLAWAAFRQPVDADPADIAAVTADPNDEAAQRRLRFARSTQPALATDDSFAVGGDNNNSSLGLTPYEFTHLVQVWRVGSVMDTRSGMLPYKCATINVVVEPWPLERLYEEYNTFLFHADTISRALLFATTARELGDIAHLLGQVDAFNDLAYLAEWRAAYEHLRPLNVDLVDVRADVTKWRHVDSSWARSKQLAFQRFASRGVVGVTRGDVAPPPPRPRGPNDVVERLEDITTVDGQQYVYAEPSTSSSVLIDDVYPGGVLGAGPLSVLMTTVDPVTEAYDQVNLLARAARLINSPSAMAVVRDDAAALMPLLNAAVATYDYAMHVLPALRLANTIKYQRDNNAPFDLWPLPR